MLIQPDWPAPANVRSIISTRHGGVSRPPYMGLNLAEHVDDDSVSVKRNREHLLKRISQCYPQDAPILNAGSILWLNQVHGTRLLNADVVSVNAIHKPHGLDADGSFSSIPGRLCAVLTADCLPILLCDKAGRQVAAIHAGWKGLAQGILTAAVRSFCCSAHDVMCYLGPAISSQHFEVGQDVKLAFELAEQQRPYSSPISLAFSASPTQHLSCDHQEQDGVHSTKWMANLYDLARFELRGLGLTRIYGGDYCTFEQSDLFYSYRRNHITGRMASLIWLA